MEISLEFYFYLLIAGIFGGVLAGLYGIEGGLLYTFILPPFFAFFPSYSLGSAFVIANSFVGVFFAALSSSIKLYKDKEIPFKEVCIAGIFAVVSSLLAHHYVVSQKWYSMTIFRVIIVSLILFMVANLFIKQKDKPLGSPKNKDMPLVGFFGGFIAALSGFGGGIVMVPMMLSIGGYDIRKAKNISLGVIVIVSGVIVVRSLFEPSIPALGTIGYVIPSICLPIIVGTFIGGPLGVIASKKIKDKKLLYSYLTLLLVLIIYYSYTIISGL